jgi:hypothetical protein
MMITLPCSTYHLPLQTARAHGSHFQMGSLSPRKPIIYRSGANLQVPRRTSLDRRNFVVYLPADRPDLVRTTGGPPHALRGPLLTQHRACLPGHATYQAARPRYGCRAGHLMPFAATLAIYAVTVVDRGHPRPTEPPPTPTMSGSAQNHVA